MTIRIQKYRTTVTLNREEQMELQAILKESYQDSSECQEIRKGTCRFNPASVFQREISLYDHMMEMDGPSVWERKDPGAKRGVVRGMSAASRRRLRKAARLPKKAVPNFFTTTYQKDVTYEEAKRHLDNFGKRMVYHYPDVFMLWRIELQMRGVPHYHFLIYRGPQIINRKGANKEVFEWMRRTWCEVTGQLESDALAASTRYERLKSMRGVHRYITKYLAKADGGGEIPGRQWGIIGRKSYKQAVEGGKLKCQVTAESWYEIKKIMIRYLEEVTKSDRWHWTPWWGRLSVFGDWRDRVMGWLPTGSLIGMA